MGSSGGQGPWGPDYPLRRCRRVPGRAPCPELPLPPGLPVVLGVFPSALGPSLLLPFAACRLCSCSQLRQSLLHGRAGVRVTSEGRVGLKDLLFIRNGCSFFVMCFESSCLLMCLLCICKWSWRSQVSKKEAGCFRKENTVMQVTCDFDQK